MQNTEITKIIRSKLINERYRNTAHRYYYFAWSIRMRASVRTPIPVAPAAHLSLADLRPIDALTVLIPKFRTLIQLIFYLFMATLFTDKMARKLVH